MRITPGDDGADGFGGVALAACLGCEGPANFREVFERGQIAFVIGEAQLLR